MLGLMLCCHSFEIPNADWTKDLHFPFALGPTNYVVGPAMAVVKGPHYPPH